MKFLTIYCSVFLLKMQPWGSFQVDEATNVFFMILRGCFISKSVFSVIKNICKIRLHVYTSLRAGVVVLGNKMSANQNAER